MFVKRNTQLSDMQRELTRTEEQVMQALWQLEQGFIKDIVCCFPEPRPAYTTVSTIIRILEKKGFVDHRAYGNSHEYFPLVSRAAYTRYLAKGLMRNYFNNSLQQLVSFFSSDKDLTVAELDEIRQLIDEEIKRKE